MFPHFVWRMTAPIIAVSALMLGIAAYAAWSVYSLQRTTSDLLISTMPNMDATGELETALHEFRDHLHRYVMTGDADHFATARSRYDDANRCLVKIERLEVTQEGKRLVASLKREYHLSFAEFPTEPPSSLTDASRADLEEVARGERLEQLLQRLHKHRQDYHQRVTAATLQNRTLTRRVGITLLLLGVCGSVLGLLGGFAIARRVHRSLVELTVPVTTAAGALNEVVGPITITSTGNIGDLGTALDELSTRVTTVVSRLQASQQETLRAEQLAAIGQLAAGLAHELRNPLTAMKTLVQVAREQDGVASLTDQDLAVLDEEISRLNTTVQYFLDYARPPKLERHLIDMGDVVSRTVQLASGRAEQQHVRVICHHEERLPKISGDREQLSHVLLNLVLNALDALGEGGTVEISVEHVPAASGNGDPDESAELRIEVADTGPGLPPDLQGRVFEPFVSSKDSGTGLGLPISRRIIEAHGGHITARNRPEGGAVFTILLPTAVSTTSKSLPNS